MPFAPSDWILRFIRKECSVNAVQVAENFPCETLSVLHSSEFYGSLCTYSIFLLQTITAIFTLIKFFCSAIFVSSYRSAVKIMKLFSVRTYWIAICIYRKIYCSVRIITIFLSLLSFSYIVNFMYFSCRVLHNTDNY